MNYRLRMVKEPVSVMDIYFENTLLDWERLRAALDFGYTIAKVTPDE